MTELEARRNKLPDSFTQTKSEVAVIELSHVQSGDDAPETILRIQDRHEIGSLEPVTIVLRPLGGPFYYRVETYEITTHGCIILSEDNEGRQVSLKPGSSLVDALILLPSQPDGNLNIHFIGKITDRITIQRHPQAKHNGASEAETENTERHGYVVRFSQIALADQDTLRAYLKGLQPH